MKEQDETKLYTPSVNVDKKIKIISVPNQTADSLE